MSGLHIACVGECMIELTQRDPASMALSYAGDTLNTALYLARVAPPGRIAVDYVTALGDDPYSDAMLAAWRAERIGTAAVARLPGKLPGLYLIHLDEEGERRFFYYRSAAAARALFADPATLPGLATLARCDLVYFSAITLSILDEDARKLFLAALKEARAKGGRVAFDSNYRPAGWPDAATARRVVAEFLPQIDIALPTFEDEQRLFGDADPTTTIARYAAHGVAETAVKLGIEGCLLATAERRLAVPVPRRILPVDTTAAGDAFNAGYLAARLLGVGGEEAALAGHRLAGAVIGHRGAIIPRAATPALFS